MDGNNGIECSDIASNVSAGGGGGYNSSSTIAVNGNGFSLTSGGAMVNGSAGAGAGGYGAGSGGAGGLIYCDFFARTGGNGGGGGGFIGGAAANISAAVSMYNNIRIKGLPTESIDYRKRFSAGSAKLCWQPLQVVPTIGEWGLISLLLLLLIFGINTIKHRPVQLKQNQLITD